MHVGAGRFRRRSSVVTKAALSSSEPCSGDVFLLTFFRFRPSPRFAESYQPFSDKPLKNPKNKNLAGNNVGVDRTAFQYFQGKFVEGMPGREQEEDYKVSEQTRSRRQRKHDNVSRDHLLMMALLRKTRALERSRCRALYIPLHANYGRSG